MKIINLEQGSSQWLSWRKTVITATDCPAILGSSPWSTAYKCWQRKLGLIEEQAMNQAMQRGIDLEPKARAQFIERYGIHMEPAVVESTEFDFLGASLDGLSACRKYILEVKCGASSLHLLASQGKIPDYYLDQIQHQLLVTGAEKCYYYSYNGTDGICVEVLPDANFIKRFLPEARTFWKCVAFAEPPALQESDYKDMSEEIIWTNFADDYRKVCGRIKELEEVKERYRKELFKLAQDQNCRGGGIKVSRVTMRGRVDYETIPEIKDVDLDKFRKPSTTTWKIVIEGEK